MFKQVIGAVSISSIALMGMAESALAGGCVAIVPAPIAGAGLPLLLAAAGVYVAVKLLRTRRR